MRLGHAGFAEKRRAPLAAMRTTLITTTYNWPAALDVVLDSIAAQTEMPDEVIIADDGSGTETAELIRHWQTRLPVPLVHAWQEDRGFRAARARNLAIAAATGEYLVFIDGDMVLERHFIADHKRAACPDSFIQGMRLHADPGLTMRILRDRQTRFSLFENGLSERKFLLRSRLLSLLEFRPTTSLRRMGSCNQAYWRAHLAAVNGFNEEMVGWGMEDDELAIRLLNKGYRRRLLKFSANAVHLDHPKRKPEGLNPNLRILADTRARAATWCQQGLDAHPGT
ncbi:MAG: glycosyltransferase [Thiobacillus sp.]|nr:glycosyltransferase [Thiobacillus sp.]